MIARIAAKFLVFRFLSWAEKKGWLYASEKSWVSDTLIPAVAAYIELMLGHEVDTEVEEALKRERRHRVITDILRKKHVRLNNTPA